MRHHASFRFMIEAFLIAMIMLGLSGHVSALDYSDIVLLRQHQVADDVILSMADEQGITALTADQENRLRAEGASENFLVALRGAATQASQGGFISEAESSLPATGMSAGAIDRTVVVAAPQPVIPLEVTEHAPLPPLYAKEGWLSISNTDLMSYFLAVDVRAKRLFLSKTPNGGFEIPAGENRAINTRKEEYKLYGDSGNDLKIRVRENEVTRLSLVPFGVTGNSGLTGVARDRDRTRSEVLFGNYVPAPPVVVRPAPVVVVPARPIYPAVPYYYDPYRYGPYRGGYYHRYGW